MDDDMDGAARAQYRFGPLARRGVIAGFRGGQLLAVAAGLLVAVVALRISSSGAGMAVGVMAVLLGAGVALWPIHGRTPEEWAPDACRYAVAAYRRRRVEGADPFGWFELLGVAVGPDGAPGARGPARSVVDGFWQSIDGAEAPGTLRAPGSWHHGGTGKPSQGTGAGLSTRQSGAPGARGSWHHAAVGGAVRHVGIVVDRRREVYSAVLRVEAPGFLLGSEADKERRVAQWAGVLASVARDGGAVHRLQWIERAVPDDGTGLWRHLEERGRMAPEEAPAASYRALLRTATVATVQHGVLLVVSVRPQQARKAVRAAGGGDRGACAVLLREVATLRRQLADAEVVSSSPFGPRALAGVLRGAIDPEHQVAAAPDVAIGAAAEDGQPGDRWGWPWPMAVDEGWSALRTDATWHAVYWVAQWPRRDAGADFLASLLLVGDVRRTVSVVMEPVGPADAARQVEQARTADMADTELRRRGGFLVTARRRREADTLAGREAELADGHAQYRFCGYVAVTAADPDSLDRGCGQVEQAAAQAGLELRRCYGDQRRAFVATLPLGYGLA